MKERRLKHRFKLERDSLESLLGDGFPVGSIILIEGEEGGGKTLLCWRICYGALKNGLSVTYLSREHTTRAFIQHMHSLDYEPLKYLVDGSLLFLPKTSLRGTIKMPLEKLLKKREIVASDIIILDMPDITKEEVNEIYSILKRLTWYRKSIILACGSDVGLGDEADIYLRVHRAPSEAGFIHRIDVVRFTGTRERFRDGIDFRVEPGVGFVLDITEVV
jgi:flagellar protein FlaH